MPAEADTDDTLTLIEPDEEGEGQEQQDDDTSSPEAAKVAALMGWKGLKDWKGDKSNWRTAEDFLAEVPEVLKNTRKANERLSGQMNRIVAQVAKLNDTQRQNMDAAQQRALSAAVEAGDVEGAKKILNAAKVVETPDEHPAFADFKARNDWFGVDDDATAYAEALDKRLAKGGITDPDAHMKRVEAGVKKAFPDLFGDAPAPKPDAPAPRAPLVARGGRGASRPSNGEVTVADLTPKQREAARSFGVSDASYVKSLNQLNAKERA